MKNLLLTLTLLAFSFSAFAINENDLNSEQKAVLYEIHAAIETEYPTVQVTVEEIEFEKEFNKAAQEFEMIIASVKTFAEKVKLPIQNFLETNLAKYVGTIVVFNFFGEHVASYFSWILTIIVAYFGLRFTNRIAYINAGETQEHSGFSKRHGEFKYETIKYKEDGAFPVIKYITLAGLTIWLLAIIF